MNKYEITKRIEKFAPLETQENWDCSGWVIDVPESDDISKIMLCLTVTDDVVRQARENNCDMIISHHPLFFVPFSYLTKDSLRHSEGENYRDPSLTLRMTKADESHKISFLNKAINIYCAHTNLDLAKGGTTDCLIEKIISSPTLILPHGGGKNFDLSLRKSEIPVGADSNICFVRYIETEISVSKFINILKPISPHLRYVNNKNIKTLHKIAFCAGSGAEFIQEAYSNGADALVTGDLKFHTALESPIVLFDIGHFESEIGVLKVFENLINNDVEVIYAQEKSPFNY